MSEDTNIFRRTRELASHPTTKKSAAIGGLSGGVSAATMVLVYQLFTTQSSFNNHAQAEKDARATQWRAIQDNVNKLDDVDKELNRLQGFLQGAGVLPMVNTKTNHP